MYRDNIVVNSPDFDKRIKSRSETTRDDKCNETAHGMGQRMEWDSAYNVIV